MGYYDQDYEHLRSNRNTSKKTWFISALIGAFVGGMLVLLALPVLGKMGLLPYELNVGVEDKNGLEEVESVPTMSKEQGAETNITLNVTSEITNAVEKVSEAVVGIVNLRETNFWSDSPGEAGTGSGVIYKKADGKAFVVTNYHVIEGASGLEVSLNDGTRVKAKLLGGDPWTDLAVLEIDASHIQKIADFGNSDAVKLGEPVIAIGNPLGLQFSGSVTQGIISGLNRTIPVDINGDGVQDWNAEVMQTDAAINPGNSGGALVNIKGEVIGINSMKIAQSAVEGIGLSIPITAAKPIIEDLEAFGEVQRPFLGIGQLKALNEISSYHRQQTLNLPKEVTDGIAILEVVANSPAAQAGIKEYDVIVEMDGEKITSVIELRKHLYNEKYVGDTLEITYYSGGEKKTVAVKLTKESL